jgi:hypothetical protein
MIGGLELQCEEEEPTFDIDLEKYQKRVRKETTYEWRCGGNGKRGTDGNKSRRWHNN